MPATPCSRSPIRKANACPTSETPFINRCQDIDAAGKLLTHLLGPLQPPAPPPAGEMIVFDQRPFVAGRAIDASLANEGYAFVPASCRNGGCKVHVAFHGCLQNAGEIGRRFVNGAGYNGWAASNRIVVLYPQTVRRYGLALGFVPLAAQPESLLGLVGLHRRQLPHPRWRPDACRPGDDRNLGNAAATGTIGPAIDVRHHKPLTVAPRVLPAGAVNAPNCPIFKAHD